MFLWIFRIVNELIYRLLQLLVLSSLLASTSFAAGPVEPFPGSVADGQLFKAQEKGDELFESGQYERAMMIYRNELSPAGDKFAQYMVGYMYLAARGVPVDVVLASAWYRLAAERGHESLVHARDVLLQGMNDEQRDRSDKLYADLRGELGDIAIVSKLIAADLTRLRQRDAPGTGLGLTPRDPNDPIRNDDDARRAGQQMRARMNYLIRFADADESVGDQERDRINALQQDVEKILISVE
jgi:TPR repeat protein